MATRAEQERADAQRRGPRTTKRNQAGTKPGSPPASRSRAKKHTARKATYALERSTGRPSRKSTRASANRAKPDAALNRTEEKRKGSPEATYRRARARATRARGK